MATYQDSWLAWKNEPSKLQDFIKHIKSTFAEKESSAFPVPKLEISVLGLKIVQLIPGSIGMAVGFSVIVKADSKKTRASLENRLKKTCEKCETDESMLACEIEMGEKKTIPLLAEEDGKVVETLFGCFYYEK
jgi:hypothetical protein